MTHSASTALAVCLLATSVLATPASAQFEDESVAAFLGADANRDEFLEFDEFRVFIRTMAAIGAPMSQRIRNLGVYRIAFGRVDLNNDGLASPDELRAAEARE
jgi:hypothetical protein